MSLQRTRFVAGAVAIAIATTAPLLPQVATRWSAFGPWASAGAMFEITRNHLVPTNGTAVALDPSGRVLTLSDWHDSASDVNLDCALTRHFPQARHLDMDFSGELEATRRIALDLGGLDDDHCTALAVDSLARPVVVGYAGAGGGHVAFATRLRESDGIPDFSFSFDGVVQMGSVNGFVGIESRFLDVAVDSSRRVVACGWVERAGERNMLVVRYTASGGLDTSFNGSGWREIDWNGNGDDEDTCSALTLLPGGKIVLAGTASGAFDGQLGYAVARLLANGALDNAFSGDGRVWLGDGSTFSVPTVADVAYDSVTDRIYVAAEGLGLGDSPTQGELLALDDAGALDLSFHATGRRDIRFSEMGNQRQRDAGATDLRRVLPIGDGRVYVAGTHFNSAADATTYGDSDVAVARLRTTGFEDTGAKGFDHGVAFMAYGVGHQDVRPVEARLAIGDLLADALLSEGNVVLFGSSNRYPAGHWGDADWDLGPLAPMLGAVIGDGIWNQGFEAEGLTAPTTLLPSIAVPSGYGHYCSVRNVLNNGFGLLPQGAISDPCDQLVGNNAFNVVERAGLYSLTGPNNVLATCGDGTVGLFNGNGTAPFDAAFTAMTGKSGCIFSAAPQTLRIFARPYTGAHPSSSSQSFNHDPYNIPIDVTPLGGTPNPSHPLAHYIDLHGYQRCAGPGTPADGTDDPQGGVDEAASDIFVTSAQQVAAVAAGRVDQAVPRYLLRYSPVGNDPFQREVFVRHSVGIGRYAEVFTTYYAHMQNTAVRRGDIVAAGDVLGRVGETGAAWGEHLHIGTWRNTNLSYRRSFELRFGADDFDDDKDVGNIDPWGWRGNPATDPWAWRFEHVPDRPQDAGAWSIDLWKAGEAPPMD